MPIHIFTQHCGSSMIIIIELPSFALFKLWGLSSCDYKSIVNILCKFYTSSIERS